MADEKDSKGNIIKKSVDKDGIKWLSQEMSFIDENGNRLRFDLQSQTWARGEPGMNAGGLFEGYTVYPVNADPDIEVVDEASAEQRRAAYKKIYNDAEKYFNEHPEQRPNEGPGRENAYITAYINIQAGKEMQKRADAGKASSLEKAYLYQVAHPEMTHNFCWKQLTGEMPLDASVKEVCLSIGRDKTTYIMKSQADEYEHSVERGRKSLENRVAEAQNARYTIRTQKRGDGGQTMKITKEKPDNTTFNEDEKNAVVYEYIKRKMKNLEK